MKSVKVGLIGFGTIGCGMVKILQDNQSQIQNRLGAALELVKIADLDITTDRGVKVDAGMPSLTSIRYYLPFFMIWLKALM